jgi:hypothetical protein
VCYSPDGTRLASASDDNTIKVWDTRSGVAIATLRGHTSVVMVVLYSPDGTRLASAGVDHTVKVWEAKSGSELATLRRHTGNVRSLAYSPDGTLLASASDDGTVVIWDNRTTPDQITLRGQLAIVTSVGYSAGGTRIISTDEEGKPLVWDIASGKPLPDEKPPEPVPTDNRTPDGQFVAVPDGTNIRIFRQPLPGGYDPWAEDRERRRVQAPPWHAGQAEAARKRGDTFAAQFHSRCLATGDNLRLLVLARLAAGDYDGCRQALRQVRAEQEGVTAPWLLSGVLASG